eukprot:TRINITY_DN414_c0_g2_i7.p1 TRINITY_DN414_c0_g2~~TRINITY_DN414_c0_g2_i7.p1  ORF type:complete len:374 (+),score=34.43 TRINITY_DN414_c0_g2_i7:97-1218(+)
MPCAPLSLATLLPRRELAPLSLRVTRQLRFASGSPVPPPSGDPASPADAGPAAGHPTASEQQTFNLGRLKKPVANTPNPTPDDPDALKVPQVSAGGTPAVTNRRVRLAGVYGKDGLEDDVLTRTDKKAEQIRKTLLEPPTEGGPVSVVGTGKGPKPQWSFLDAGPRGWWPNDERFIAAPPDKYGRPPAVGVLTQSPNTVRTRGTSSTERTREARDVWLTQMGLLRRLGLALGRRLTPQEHDMLRTSHTILCLVAFVSVMATLYQAYLLYQRYRFMYSDSHTDPKLRRICHDLLEVQSKRGDEYVQWWLELTKVVPIPRTMEAEAELAWRECIKKGWITLGDDDKWMVEKEFQMTYIPPLGLTPADALAKVSRA